MNPLDWTEVDDEIVRKINTSKNKIKFFIKTGKKVFATVMSLAFVTGLGFGWLFWG